MVRIMFRGKGYCSVLNTELEACDLVIFGNAPDSEARVLNCYRTVCLLSVS